MTSTAILLVTKILQNRDLLECAGAAKFVENEDGHVEHIHIGNFSVRRYERPDQRHGIVFKFEFFQRRRPYFTVQDFYKNPGNEPTVVFLKKDPKLQHAKMEEIVYSINELVDNTINSMNHVAKYLIGAAA